MVPYNEWEQGYTGNSTAASSGSLRVDNKTNDHLLDNSRKGRRLRVKKAKNPKSNFEKPWVDKTWDERMRRNDPYK